VGHREDLLAGARRCLRERGYARTTARDLVAASGTNLASIGYHFGSKEALLNQALAETFAEWAERVRALALAAAPAGSTDPALLVAASLQAMYTSFAEYRALGVAFVEALAQAEHRPELRAQLAAVYRDSRAQVARMVTEAVPGLSPAQATAMASFEIAMCDGLLVQWLLDPDGAPTGVELVDALGTLLARRPAAEP
jgi:AcrR family transcriptional regulator